MQKYNILELNGKQLPELQEIAETLGIKKVKSLQKEEIVYKILDEQAISWAGLQVEKEARKKEKRTQKGSIEHKTSKQEPLPTKSDEVTAAARRGRPPKDKSKQVEKVSSEKNDGDTPKQKRGQIGRASCRERV